MHAVKPTFWNWASGLKSKKLHMYEFMGCSIEAEPPSSRTTNFTRSKACRATMFGTATWSCTSGKPRGRSGDRSRVRLPRSRAFEKVAHSVATHGLGSRLYSRNLPVADRDIATTLASTNLWPGVPRVARIEGPGHVLRRVCSKV